MSTHQRDQPLVREVFGWQGVVHVGCTCIPPRTPTVARADARTVGVQTQGTKFTCSGAKTFPLLP